MTAAAPVTARAPEARSRRTFPAVCGSCLRDVQADLVVDGGDAFHEKHCPEHGDQRWLVSENGERYAAFDRHYHSLFTNEATPPPLTDAYFAITNRCNQACDYCGTEANRFDGYFGDYELERFREQVATSPSRTIGLIGGEPLMHPRFFDFVEVIGASGRRTQLFTNGLGLSDEDTVRRLLAASRGKCIVRMSFEGFTDAEYEHLANPRARERKLATLANLARLRVPVTVSHTITEAEQADPPRLRRVMRSLIEHAMEHRAIGAVNFQALSPVGASRGRAIGDAMSVDRVMDRIVDALPVPVDRGHVYLTQQLVQLISRVYGLPMCKYHQAVVLARLRGGWVSVDHFLDCRRLERRLEARAGAWPESRAGLAAALFADLLACVRPGHLLSSVELGAKLVGLFARRLDNASLPSCILPVNAGTTCDRNNFDATIGRRCEKWSYSQLGAHVHPETISQMTMRLARKRGLDVVS